VPAGKCVECLSRLRSVSALLWCLENILSRLNSCSLLEGPKLLARAHNCSHASADRQARKLGDACRTSEPGGRARCPEARCAHCDLSSSAGTGDCDVGRGDLGKSRARKLEGGQLCCQRGFLRMSPTTTVVTSLKGSAAWPRLLRLSLLFRCCGVATCFLISRRQLPALETREGMKKKGRCQGFPR
jgi:hypothetical protein